MVETKEHPQPRNIPVSLKKFIYSALTLTVWFVAIVPYYNGQTNLDMGFKSCLLSEVLDLLVVVVVVMQTTC